MQYILHSSLFTERGMSLCDYFLSKDMSDWKNIQTIYTNGEDPEKFSLIIGEFYDRKVLGMCWTRYCQTAPMIVDDNVRNIILSGLLQQELNKQNDVSKLLMAIRFFQQD